jgi:hypothetical protein
MVSAAFLAFLLELGIHPGQIGVHDLHDVRRIAWSDSVPETVRGCACRASGLGTGAARRFGTKVWI